MTDIERFLKGISGTSLCQARRWATYYCENAWLPTKNGGEISVEPSQINKELWRRKERPSKQVAKAIRQQKAKDQRNR